MDEVILVAVDTNVFIYRVESKPSDKHERAKAVVNALKGRMVVPVQVLAETSRVLLSRRSPALRTSAVRSYVDGICAAASALVPLTIDIVRDAIKGVDNHMMSYYDAQIWAASKQAGATVLLTEDFQDCQEVEGVRFVNPFAQAFDLAKL